MPETQTASLRARARKFIRERIAPYAGEWDQSGRLPADLPAALGQAGLLAQAVPAAFGGEEADPLAYGMLHAELGAACASTRALLTVHDMVACAIARWGDEGQKRCWLPALATGELLGAFALTEPEAGSDAQAIAATALREGDAFVLQGHKRWITGGQLAGLILVIARCDGRPSALLVQPPLPGLNIRPMPAPLGMRAAMLAELEFDHCRLEPGCLLGPPGAGVAHIAATALGLGRYAVAWGCVGLLRACLAEAVRHARRRVQFGTPIRQHQLIQQMIAQMAIELRAAELLCREAGRLRATGDPEAVIATAVAKTYASQAAQRGAEKAVQIMGAEGCAPGSDAQRHFRDAKVMEIIEGSTQIQQILIATDALQRRADDLE